MLVMHGLGAEDAILFDGEVFAWWLFSFPLILVLMACVLVAMLVYFRRRGWL